MSEYPGVNKYVHQANKGLTCICSLHSLTRLIHLGNAKHNIRREGERDGEKQGKQERAKSADTSSSEPAG